MKRLLILVVGTAVAFSLAGCPGGDKPPIQDEFPPTPIDTTPEPEPEIIDTTPPEPEVREISESEFQTVYFDFDKFNVKPEFRGSLESNAELMQESMDLIIQIEGHCDERGTVEYNLSLGEKRANATKSYLINLGIADERIQVISYGKERPAMLGHNEAAWSQNRRAEFRIISQ
ncbi:MAG: peptidoglycan-associated lipoprotein Pal [Candidatus Zixiibacteriota bacterium]